MISRDTRLYKPNNRLVKSLAHGEQILRCLLGDIKSKFDFLHGASDLKVIHQSEKTLIGIVSCSSETFVLKKHLNPNIFFREAAFFSLMSRRSSVVSLKTIDWEHHVLILEYLPQMFSVLHMNDFKELVKAIAIIHGTDCRHNLAFEISAIELSVGATLYESVSNKHNFYLLELFRYLENTLGSQYVPRSIVDLKSEHFRVRNGDTCLIDFDAFTTGVCEQFDLIALVLDHRPHNVCISDALESAVITYLEVRRNSYSLTQKQLRYSLDLAAASIGIVL